MIESAALVSSRLPATLFFGWLTCWCAGIAWGAAGDNAEAQHKASVVLVAPAVSARNRGIHSQLTHVATPVADHYIRADSVALALAIVPDPLVPRYRRLYDLNILALELGMLADGYVLDRFSLPWSEELRQDPSGTPAGADSHGSNINSGSYGLMIFRCDAWRGDLCSYPGAKPDADHPHDRSTRLRALYIVTETATSGVAPFPLECAILDMEAQTRTGASGKYPPIAPECPKPPASAQKGVTATLLQHPLCPASADGHSIVILGPSFSGAMDSIGSTVEGRIPNAARGVCLISTFATDASNDRITMMYRSVQYQAVALDSRRKIKHLAHLSQQLAATPGRDTAILAEASTFGYGVCQRGMSADEPSRRLCESPRFYFPPTIADIAYGIQKQQAQETNDLVNAARQVQDTHHVSLEAGAENGSEYPASESSSVTPASNQLQLDRVMAELVTLGPKIVIVAATDVRDRLFLFDQLREKLPRAMLVDLEADNLLAHPSFLHASRGSLAMASVNLTGAGSTLYTCEPPNPEDPSRSSWSIDGQALLAQNTAYLYERNLAAPVPQPCARDPTIGATRQAALQLVTFHGFAPVSYPFPSQAAAYPRPPRPNFRLLIFTEVLAILFCIALAALWLWPWILERTSQQASLNTIGPRTEKACVVLAVLSGALFLPCALIVAHNSTDQPGHELMYWSIAAELLGVVGMWRCYRQIRLTLWASGHAAYSSPLLSACLAIVAVAFAIAAALVSSHMGVNDPWLNPTLLNAVGFDPESGVAFYLVVALAAMMTLYASALLAFRVWVVRRNFRLLILASSQAKCPIPFVARDVDNKPVEVLHGYKPLPLWVVVLVSTLIVAAAGAPGLLDYLGGPRLTVFGPFAARTAVLALAVTTLCASILLSAAFGAGRRVIALCGYVRGRILDKPTRTPSGSQAEIPGLWSGGAEMPISFPATPVLAVDSGAGAYVWGAGAADKPGSEAAGRAWAAALSQILYDGIQNGRSRFALFALLVSELSLFRWIAAGAVLCAFASVAIVYLYPIEADTLLVLNLVILALSGILCAYLAVVFEREEVLSNIVCNRSKKTQVSVGLFSFIASPFVALAAAIALIGVPGVVDWAGGLFVMLRSLGIHP